MKKLFTFFIIALLSAFSLSAQNLPCEFSWKEVKEPNGVVKDFTTPGKEQPFQNPCISYAFIGAIESMYKIEYNVNSNTILSDAYLDINLATQNMLRYRDTLQNHSFRIPKEIMSGDDSIILNSFLPEIDNPHDPVYSGFYENAKVCVNQDRSFELINVNTGGTSPIFRLNEEECGDPITNFITVGNVISLNNIANVDSLKTTIINHGPVVMKSINYTNFVTYNSNASYHAYTIIGWKDDGNNTIWKLKDSWTDDYGFKNSISINNNTFMNLLNTQDIELYRVDDIQYFNNNTLQPRPSRYNVVWSNQNQCTPPPPATPVLSSIYVDLHTNIINGKLYSKFSVNSDVSVDQWEYQVSPSCLVRDTNAAPVADWQKLISPITNGFITVKVRGKQTGGQWSLWKEKTIYLSNGSSPGGGF